MTNDCPARSDKVTNQPQAAENMPTNKCQLSEDISQAVNVDDSNYNRKLPRKGDVGDHTLHGKTGNFAIRTSVKASK